MEEKAYKLIFNAGVARSLLKMGVPIADIKADKSNKDKTVFAFKCTPDFEKAFAEINEGIKNAKEAKVS